MSVLLACVKGLIKLPEKRSILKQMKIQNNVDTHISFTFFTQTFMA